MAIGEHQHVLSFVCGPWNSSITQSSTTMWEFVWETWTSCMALTITSRAGSFSWTTPESSVMLSLTCFCLERGLSALRRTIQLPYPLQPVFCPYQFPLPLLLPVIEYS